MKSKYFNFFTGIIFGITLTLWISTFFKKNKNNQKNDYSIQKDSIFKNFKSQFATQLANMNKNSISLSFKNLNNNDDDDDALKIKKSEDTKFKYIEISLEDLIKESLNISVTKSMIHISGDIRKLKKTAHSTLSYTSSFDRNFLAPIGTNHQGVLIEKSKNKVILKFPKL